MLAQEVEQLIERQLSNWQLARRNFEALQGVRTRTLLIDGCETVLQFNPERIRSSAAKTDAASLLQRKCFLCNANQPNEQEQILWRGRYKLQVNPYPIFPRHLTIASINHTPQSMVGRVAEMLQLAEELPDFVVFYNGAKCGASAPDHMHFQAGNKGFLPFVTQFEAGQMATTVVADGIAWCHGAPFRPFVITAKSIAQAQQLFAQLTSLAPKSDDAPEPMMNVLCWKTSGGTFQMAVFLRKKHRPDCYGDGEGQFLLSPGLVDLAQVIVVPVERNYNLLDAATVRAIFDELCIDKPTAERIIEDYTSQ